MGMEDSINNVELMGWILSRLIYLETEISLNRTTMGAIFSHLDPEGMEKLQFLRNKTEELRQERHDQIRKSMIEELAFLSKDFDSWINDPSE